MIKEGEVFSPYKVFVGLFIPNVIAKNRNLSAMAKLCYGQLCLYSGRNGCCWPSQQQIAEDIGTEVSYIKEVLKELEIKGFILKVAPTGVERIQHYNNKYYFVWHESFISTEDGVESEKENKSMDGGYSLPPERGQDIRPIVKESLVKESLGASKEAGTINCSTSSEAPIYEAPNNGASGSSDSEGSLRFPVTLKKRIPGPIVFEAKPTPFKINRTVLDIINYWNNSPGLAHHKMPAQVQGGGYVYPSKTFSDVVSTVEKVLYGKFFASTGLTEYNRPYSKEEIILAIDRFKLTATNVNYYPSSKTHFKSIGLHTFFYNPYSEKVKSQFIQCLSEEPKLIKIFVRKEIQNNPQLTSWLKEIYTNKVLFGQQKSFSDQEENKFIKGANQLHETINNLQRRLNMMTRPIEWCGIVIDALIDHWKGEEILPGHIASEYTYNTVVPKYLKTKGRID